jgi:glycosyltransferase involved in cell wall biosynthesis
VVSVIITTYNRRDFLAEALQSVFDQDYGDKEILIIDDGSTDGTNEIVPHRAVTYLWKENEGISSARNAGIERARGDYLAFLDSDDLWKKKKLSTQVKAMEIVGASISYTDEIWMKYGRRMNQGKRHRKYAGNIYEQCLPLCIISPSSVMMKKAVFEDVGLFDETLPVCEDYDMWLRVCSRYPVLFIPEALIVKRGGHADQLSSSYEVMDRYRIQAMTKALRSCSLTEPQRQGTLSELRKKCNVVARGAEKRGRYEEARHYRSLPELIGPAAQVK